MCGMRSTRLALIGLVALQFVMHGTAQAQTGSAKSKGDKGASYTAEFYGDLVLGSGGSLSNALMQAKGQYFLVSQKLLVTTGDLAQISGQKIVIQVAGKAQEFAINASTKLCRGQRPATWDSFKKGEVVTITGKEGIGTALSVRSGPMLFGNVMNPPVSLKRFDCSQR